MPGLPGFNPADPTANLIRESGLTVSMVDKDGRTSTVRLSNLGAQDLAIGENTRWVQAVGSASNMGAYGWNEDRTNERLIVDAQVFDETHSDASQVLQLKFQNNEGRVKDVYIPAPKATLFAEDGVTLIDEADIDTNDTPEQAIVRELKLAAQNVINTSFLPVNSYTFVQGRRRSRRVSLPSGASAKPQKIEPATNTGSA